MLKMGSFIKKILLGLCVPIFLASCSTSASSSTSTTSTLAVPDHVVWLCKPGLANNPCTSSLTTRVKYANGTTNVKEFSDANNPPIDCFYVYPTVSTQKTGNANLTIDPAETGVAMAQASRFSQDCNVYAPMYRQLTVSSLLGQSTTKANGGLGYSDVLAAWKTYLADYNHGRGFVLIGHSQGSFVLTQLIQQQIDNNPQVRKHLVSALLLGGNINVPIGKSVGGTFKNIPACTSTSQTGCVIAYSSFSQEPPSNAIFGRTMNSNNQVLCTNPAALGGGSATLDPYMPTHVTGIFAGINIPNSDPTLPWINYPDSFTGQCMYQNGSSWLQISPLNGSVFAAAFLKTISAILGPTWGLHLIDVNITLGDMTNDVALESAAYRHQ